MAKSKSELTEAELEISRIKEVEVNKRRIELSGDQVELLKGEFHERSLGQCFIDHNVSLEDIRLMGQYVWGPGFEYDLNKLLDYDEPDTGFERVLYSNEYLEFKKSNPGPEVESAFYLNLKEELEWHIESKRMMVDRIREER
jgi:hypothetical protein